MQQKSIVFGVIVVILARSGSRESRRAFRDERDYERYERRAPRVWRLIAGEVLEYLNPLSFVWTADLANEIKLAGLRY